MHELLTAMSIDMGIPQITKEAEDQFAYRLCYSALGQWCLNTAKNTIDGVVGTTKHNQTIVLNELIDRFSVLFPFTASKFVDENSLNASLAVKIRRLYEETGYLLTDKNNRNKIANFGRTINIGTKSLFFGLPLNSFSVNGLGVYSSPTDYQISVNDFLIRDVLNCEEFFLSRYNPIDFEERNIESSELEFFNPVLNRVPSQSWVEKMETNCTVARKKESGVFYRVMKIDGVCQLAEEPIEPQNETFTSYEYRRLYFALKSHYDKPVIATLMKLDNIYSRIKINAHLPNREYYLLLLIAWPEHNAFDKVSFIIANEFLPEVLTMLMNIGIEIKGVETNE